MPKGYVIARIEIHDMEAFQAFPPLAGEALKKFGGKTLVRDPTPDIREGALQGVSVVVEFDSVETARAFYESEEYTLARQARDKASVTDFRIVSGV